MSFEAARTDMVTATQAALAAWAGDPSPLKIAYDNFTNVDLENQTDPYLVVELYFIDGKQLSMGPTKDLVDYGQIHLVAHTPQNAGTLKGYRILDFFRPYYELKDLSAIRTAAAKGAAAYSKNGWHCLPLVIPFALYRLVTS